MFELLRAQVLAKERDFPGLMALADQYLEQDQSAANRQGLANILLSVGLNTYAAGLFHKAYQQAPNDLAPLVGYANCLKDLLEHEEALRIYRAIHQALPDNLLVRRNLLLAMEYAGFVSDQERFECATSWGTWASARFGGEALSLATRPNGPLRVGYLSADLCQHTVGLFLRGVLQHHSNNVQAFTYHSGKLRDGVTNEIAQASTFRDVSGLSDEALVQTLHADQLHVVIDLSGHTAGSRAHVLARRVAPVQLSWLGYFATTGLLECDGVVLDRWHVTPESHSCFVEPIIELKHGRLCFLPMEFSPAVTTLPGLHRGHITFGSFNNTSKYSKEVLELWAKILQALPESRLVLKWRTFDDPRFCDALLRRFKDLGIDPGRIELRGFSTHDQMLAEYADIDIALDPLPFSGGLTSCEALWMGVPVVTWPQSRVVSRQTYAFLSAIGQTEWVASNPQQYVQIAQDLAQDPQALATIRSGLRARMQASVLMDLAGFTAEFEAMLTQQLERKLGTYK